MKQSAGFVLMLTLWLLAGMTIALGFVAASATRILESVHAFSEESQWEVDLWSTRATILYVGATNSLSYAGLRTSSRGGLTKLEDEFNPFSADLFAASGDEIRLDGRKYRGMGSVVFSMQDSGSLIALNGGVASDTLENLLVSMDISESAIPSLIAALNDYKDRDEIPSLDGAEKNQYLKAGMLPPTNRLLVSPTQILNVRGWGSALEDRYADFLTEVSVLAGNRLNFNTLTPGRLMLLDGLTQNARKTILDYRIDGHFRSVADVNEVTDLIIPSDEFSRVMTPMASFRIVFSGQKQSRLSWLGVKFTPMSGFAPWQIDYNVRIKAGENTTHQQDIVNLDASKHPKKAIFR